MFLDCVALAMSICCIALDTLTTVALLDSCPSLLRCFSHVHICCVASLTSISITDFLPHLLPLSRFSHHGHYVALGANHTLMTIGALLTSISVAKFLPHLLPLCRFSHHDHCIALGTNHTFMTICARAVHVHPAIAIASTLVALLTSPATPVTQCKKALGSSMVFQGSLTLMLMHMAILFWPGVPHIPLSVLQPPFIIATCWPGRDLSQSWWWWW